MRHANGLVVLGLLAAGCGPAAPPAVVCEGRLTGAATATFTGCNTFEQLYRQNLNTLLLVVQHAEQAPTPGALSYTVSFDVEVTGEPRAGRTSQQKCNARVESGPKDWATAPGSECQATFSEVVPYPQQGNTITYCVLRGRLQGTLAEDPPPALPSDPLDVRLDFQLAPASLIDASVEEYDAKVKAACQVPDSP